MIVISDKCFSDPAQAVRPRLHSRADRRPPGQLQFPDHLPNGPDAQVMCVREVIVKSFPWCQTMPSPHHHLGGPLLIPSNHWPHIWSTLLITFQKLRLVNYHYIKLVRCHYYYHFYFYFIFILLYFLFYFIFIFTIFSNLLSFLFSIFFIYISIYIYIILSWSLITGTKLQHYNQCTNLLQHKWLNTFNVKTYPFVTSNPSVYFITSVFIYLLCKYQTTF